MRGDARTAAPPPMERGLAGDCAHADRSELTACSHGNVTFGASFSEGVGGTAAGVVKALTTVPPIKSQRRGDSAVFSSVGVDGRPVPLHGPSRLRSVHAMAQRPAGPDHDDAAVASHPGNAFVPERCPRMRPPVVG